MSHILRFAKMPVCDQQDPSRNQFPWLLEPAPCACIDETTVVGQSERGLLKIAAPLRRHFVSNHRRRLGLLAPVLSQFVRVVLGTRL